MGELKKSIESAIATGEKRAKLVEKNGAKMDADTKWLINNKLNEEISKLRTETDASVEKLSLMNKEARAEMKKETIYAIRSAASVAKADLALAVKDGQEKMEAFEKKAAKTHADSAIARKALKAEVAANAKEISRQVKDAVATDARAQNALKTETAASIKKTNTSVDAYAVQMKKISEETRVEIKATTKSTLAAIATEQERAQDAVEKFSSEDAARQASALKFLAEQVAGAVKGLNDNLAKQAALADSRFEKTVKDISKAR